MKRRMISLLLAFLLVLTLLPASAMAEEPKVPEGYAAEETVAEEAAAEEAAADEAAAEEISADDENEIIEEPETAEGSEISDEPEAIEESEVIDGPETGDGSDPVEEPEVSEVPETAEGSEIVKEEEPEAEPDKEPAEKPAEEAVTEAAEVPAEAAAKETAEEEVKEPAEDQADESSAESDEKPAEKQKNSVTEEEPARDASSGRCGDNLTWTLSDDGVLTISGTGPTWYFEEDDPGYYPYRDEITSLVIENGVTSLGIYAFYDLKNLSSVTFPESVTTIGNSSFQYCSSLSSVTIPAGVTSIGSGAFMQSGLVEITFRGSVPNIGVNAFSGITATAYYPVGDATWTADVRQNYGGTITWANGKCGDNAYWTLDDGTLTISGTGAMTNYSGSSGAPWSSYKDSITSLVIENGVSRIGDYSFYECTNLSSVSIPNSVVYIGFYSFIRCEKLRGVSIPDSVQTIAGYAFCECDLRTVTIPASVTSIGYAAFCSNKSLSGILVESGNTAYTSEYGILFTADKTKIHTYPCGRSGSYTIPDTVTTIGNAAFQDCALLTEVTIPDTVTSIGDLAFRGCGKLTSITIPAAVTSMGLNAFIYCFNLKTVFFLGAAPAIGNYSFYGVTATMYYPADDSSWTEDIMQNYGGTLTWTGYYSGTCGANGDNVSWILIDGVMTISGFGAMTGYNYGGAPWDTYRSQITSVVVKSGVTSIGEWAFSDLENLTSVSLPAGLKIIRGYAFRSCKNLSSVTLPAGLEYIGESAFYYCISLTNVTIPDSVTSIDDAAFLCCYSLTGVTIPDSVVSIGGSAFTYCGLTGTITIPESVTSIGHGAFSGCSSLTSISVAAGNPNYTSVDGVLFSKDKKTLIQYPGGGSSSYTFPDGVTAIDTDAFKGALLMSVTIPDSVTSIGECAFYESALTTVEIPDSVTSIGEFAFSYCDSLKSVTMGNGITDLTRWMFGYCDKLEEIKLPENLTSIGDDAFYECKSLKSITIPAGVTSIKSYAFYGCKSMTDVYFKGGVPEIGNDLFAAVYNTVTMHYLPVESFGWTSDVMQNYGGKLNWVCDNKCGDDVTWYLSSDGKLTISGTGDMWNYVSWYGLEKMITSIDIRDGVTCLGGGAFIWCTAVTEVTIPNSVTSIGNDTLQHCESLVNITLPDNLQSIGYYAFSSCRSLKDITIPAAVTYIDDGAFNNCGKLKTITFQGPAPTFGTDCFESVTAKAYYPANDATWTDSVRKNYGGTITWVGVIPLPEITDISMSTEGAALTWKKVPGATKYEISRTEEAGSGAVFMTATGTEHTDAAARSAETYTYKVRAYANGKWTDYGEEKTFVFNPFTDIDPKAKKTFNYVSWAFNNEIVRGTTSTTFSPDDSCTRIQFVMMLWKLNGEKTVKGTNPFKDISGSKTTKAILWALDANIIKEAEYFNPDDNISRIQIVMMLWKMAGEPEVDSKMPFKDISGVKTIKAVKWAYNNGKGITTGTSDTTFSPNDNCTRVQLVFFLRKYNDIYHVI